jgi:choline kinase
VEFRKGAEVACDFFGESVGFFRLSTAAAVALAGMVQRYIERGRCEEEYEEALRGVLLWDQTLAFGFEEVTDLPWIEIDFPEDVHRAQADIVPRLWPTPSARIEP